MDRAEEKGGTLCFELKRILLTHRESGGQCQRWANVDIVLMPGVGVGLLVSCFCELLEYFRRSQLVESVRLLMGSSSTARWEFFLGEQGEVDIASEGNAKYDSSEE